MSPRCRASLVSLVLFVCFLQDFIEGEVLRRTAPAHSVFLRSKRANMFLVEEILQGNLERECHEERCDYEEAREYFEDNEKTNAFWTVYYDGDQCQPNPCLHSGNCTDTAGGFVCSCVPPFYGPACELGAVEELRDRGTMSAPMTITTGWETGDSKEISPCPTEGPTACHQLCTASLHSFTCSCMPGFKLQSDNRSCEPEVEFPCGRLPDKFNATMLPWQVSLLDRRGVELCGGVVVGRRSVLTAGRCLLLGPVIPPLSLFVLAGNRKVVIPVRAFHIHNRFLTNRHEYDLALVELVRPLPFSPALVHLCLPTKDFCENILMSAGRMGITQKRNQNQNLVYMTLDECRSELNVSHPISNKMFCMRRQNGAQWSQHGLLRSQHGGHGRLSKAENCRRLKTEAHKFSESDGTSMSEVRRCGGLLPGTPVATVEKDTAFLTGLLISPSAGCHGDSGGMVFTKVSRYLAWIKKKLEAAEDHKTSQVHQYPENH
ncbi:protein Z, vitamin K-dependent plasma glycoprotein b isoform X1 [Thunnus albacares]|uniref:protein Z, vitamin K-dependent plasma glycoprotein b isoform X1 n=1 Tax=Thunnus albacares TaxID=8236 RepID=UPI001CF6D143|nr:protein Z, vitamin K-dependent plasma glycoprotein b isoform X1 [Thunnus albacares]